MKITVIYIIYFFLTVVTVGAKNLILKGRVYDAVTKEALYYASVNLEGTHIYDLTKEDGAYSLEDIQPGKYIYRINILGYAPVEEEITVVENNLAFDFYLSPSNLALEEVVVTAESTQSKSGSTTYKIGSQAIQQLQAVSVSDILQLLPGSEIEQASLNSVAQVNLRNVSDDAAKSNSFGTAIIIDGNQLSNDGNMQAYNSSIGTSGGNNVAGKGVDLRDIPASNIESVEVVAGVASAKYGNITSGAVLIKRKAGYTPLYVSFNSTPTSYQGGINKGFKLKDGSFLNTDFDYTYSNSSAVSEQLYYQRVNTGLRWTKELSKKLSWSNNMSYSYGLGFDGERDDPDEIIVLAERSNQNHNHRFSTHGSMKVLGQLNYSLNTNFSRQQMSLSTLESGPIPIIESLVSGTYRTTFSEISFNQKVEVYGAPFNFNGRIDTDQYFKTGKLKHSTNSGIEYTYDKNYGKGRVLEEEGNAASTAGAGARAMNFHNIPASENLSLYAQDDISFGQKDCQGIVRIGGRYSYMLRKYHLLSPRLSTSLKLKDKYRFRVAYGLSYKAPSMLQLYPGPTYFDLINFSHWVEDESDRYAIVTTYVYQPVNEDLEPSRGETFEVGFDYEHEGWIARFTGFRKNLSGGVNSYNVLKVFNKEIYKETGKDEDGNTLAAPNGETLKVASTMTAYGNTQESSTSGLEMSLNFPKIKATNTRFSLSGSYMSTLSLKSNPLVKSASELTGATKNRYGVYEQPEYQTSLCRSTLTVVQQVPEIKLLVTFIAEADWYYDHSVNEFPSEYPIAYYSGEGEYISIPEELRSTEAYEDLLYSNNFYTNTPRPTHFNFHLQVRKETEAGHSFSFYANNFMWYNPTFEDDTTNTISYLNGRVTFGFGMNFKF